MSSTPWRAGEGGVVVADEVPTAADAGKVLVISAEGKVVPGTAGPNRIIEATIDVPNITDLTFFELNVLIPAMAGDALQFVQCVYDGNFSSNVSNLVVLGCTLGNPANGDMFFRLGALGGDVFLTNDLPILLIGWT